MNDVLGCKPKWLMNYMNLSLSRWVFPKRFSEVGPGCDGRVGTHGGTLSSYVVKNIALDKTDDSSPREGILRHAKAARDSPYRVSPAYSKIQPQTMFAQVESDDEETKNEPEWKKRKIWRLSYESCLHEGEGYWTGFFFFLNEIKTLFFLWKKIKYGFYSGVVLHSM